MKQYSGLDRAERKRLTEVIYKSLIPAQHKEDGHNASVRPEHGKNHLQGQGGRRVHLQGWSLYRPTQH